MVASVVLVAVLTLAFAIGTGQRITTFGLYIVGRDLRGDDDRPAALELRDAERRLPALARGAAARAARRRSGPGRPSARDARLEPRRDRLRVRGRGRARARRSGRARRRRRARRADRRRRRPPRERAARARRRFPPARRPRADRAAHDRAPDRAWGVRARPGGAALRRASADLRRRRFRAQALVRSARLGADRGDRAAVLARHRRTRQVHLARARSSTPTNGSGSARRTSGC